MPSDGSAATQMADVNDLVAKGVKAIAISPSDPNMETPWLNNLSKSVSIITVDSDAPASKRLAYLGTDNYAAGQLAGQLIKQALPKGGKIVLFVGKKNAENAVEREQGITDCLAGSNVHILDIMEDNADIGKAKANAARAIADYPDLAMEVGLWSKNGPAILSAVNDAHRIGKIKIVCFDQDVDTLSGIKSNAIYATVVQQPYEIGYQSTKLLAHLVAGDNSGLPKTGTKYFESKAITHANVDQYMADLSKETGTYWGP
jgi:ribose transport system substrate-binding protein